MLKDSSRVKQHVRCCDRRALTFELALLEVNKYDFCFGSGSIEIPGKKLSLFNEIVAVGMRYLSVATKRKRYLCF